MDSWITWSGVLKKGKKRLLTDIARFREKIGLCHWTNWCSLLYSSLLLLDQQTYIIIWQCLLKMFPVWLEHKLAIRCTHHWSVSPVSQTLFSSLPVSKPFLFQFFSGNLVISFIYNSLLADRFLWALYPHDWVPFWFCTSFQAFCNLIHGYPVHKLFAIN